jgi:hypothetical protein
MKKCNREKMIRNNIDIMLKNRMKLKDCNQGKWVDELVFDWKTFFKTIASHLVYYLLIGITLACFIYDYETKLITIGCFCVFGFYLEGLFINSNTFPYKTIEKWVRK